MDVVVHTRTRHEGLDRKLGFVYASTAEELLAVSDIVSIHVPGTLETKEMVNRDFLAHMKPDAVLINTSRGSIVNEEHLFAHIEANTNFWYGTDVFNGEPAGTKEVAFINSLAQHPRVYGTHHIGASTKQSETAIGEEAVRVILKYADKGIIDNCVNKEVDDSQLHRMSIRHYDRVGVLAHVFLVFQQFNWNVQELENVVFKGRDACVANIKFSGDIQKSEQALSQIRMNEDVIDITFSQL